MRTAIIADDHDVVRHGLAAVLAEIDDVELVAQAANGIEAISLVKQHHPTLLLLDAAMPMARGIEVFSEARRWSPDTRIALVTGFTSTGLLTDWMAAGVDGLFLKSCAPDEMKTGFEAILSGGNYIAEEIIRMIAEKSDRPELTAREREVLALIAAGNMNAAIATRLSISAKTVEKHRASLMAKVGAHSISELLVYALREGLLDEHRQL
ncbi:MAG: response regulator transcription factor [Sphingorhabdus sp.]